MSFSRLLETEAQKKDPHELKKELDELEIQVFRMRQNIKEIAKKWDVIGIDQTKEENWVVVYASDDGDTCQIMLSECDSAFRGNWDFAIQAEYKDDHTIHIGDIKGPSNQGFGSIAISHLKEHAREQNIQYITGDIVQRDWDHVDRLEHFYEKHHFDVTIDYENKEGDIVWNDR